MRFTYIGVCHLLPLVFDLGPRYSLYNFLLIPLHLLVSTSASTSTSTPNQFRLDCLADSAIFRSVTCSRHDIHAVSRCVSIEDGKTDWANCPIRAQKNLDCSQWWDLLVQSRVESQKRLTSVGKSHLHHYALGWMQPKPEEIREKERANMVTLQS